MTDMQFTNDITVRLLDTNFSDERVCIAARTSTAGEDADPTATAGLINSLMKNRHGSPFEHMSATWQVKAPLFVWREHHRHRIASYNEESARYKVLAPEFYVPGPDRPMVQVGKAMSYDVQQGDPEQYYVIRAMIEESSAESYSTYQALLNLGVAREVARDVLPVNIMSTCVVTMNARGLMNFLSLRVDSEDSTYRSKPLREIQMVADQYERDFAQRAPITHSAFVANGRVAP
jgi:thymidylate synthase (FAD)